MAWNEPGGPGKKDPWGGGKEQGPPDLDEVVKKMQDKLGSLFGGKRRGSGGPGAGGGGAAGSGTLGASVILIVAGVAWGLSGFYIVQEGTRGVVLQFGKFVETTVPGMHWVPRFIQSYDIVDISQIRSLAVGYRAAAGKSGGASVGGESLMLTQDENIVDVKMTVQYNVKSPSDFLFSVRDPEISLRQAAESAVREIVGKNQMDFVLGEGRTEITIMARDLIQKVMDRYETGLVVTSVNMQDAQPPEQVQDAFADAVKAREDNERLKNEAEAYSNDILPKARGFAARKIEEANGYKQQVIAEAQGDASRFQQVLTEYKKAPLVTRKRLYMEAVESVMTHSSKVMVDVKGGNNMLYLPLDRMIEHKTPEYDAARATAAMPSADSGTKPASSARTDQPIRESIRGREER